ncbi:MAG: hypothetical protein IIB45_02365 [Candidatus Marinimicrobia bacterium]|nr:hypothetical protein [Candidatus Neomarinimicrobiota bacterium]
MVYKQKSRVTKIIAVFMIYSMILPSTVAFGQTVQKNYYYEGQVAAGRDYNGDGAMVGGIACGVIGLIGWGLGYLVVANLGADVPHHYTSNFDTTQRNQFEEGYKNYVKNTRKRKFNKGAGFGFSVLFVLVIS